MEMKHAEAFAERIAYMGGTPITKPTEIKMGGDLRKMIQDDLAGERMAIQQYKSHIKLAEELNDPVTRQLLLDIVKSMMIHGVQSSGLKHWPRRNEELRGDGITLCLRLYLK